MGVAAWGVAMLGTILSVSAEAASPEAAEAGQEWYEALLQGEFRFGFRYRFEQVDDAALDDPAEASTLRSRITYRSAAWNRWSALVEIDDVRPVGADLYNSTRNGESNRPVVPDPEGTELNQAALQYSASRYFLALGRQRLNLDNQRFVGASNWRQNEQTYDTVTARARLPRTDVLYGYVENVNRPFGPDDGMPPADFRGQAHLLNVRQDAGSLGSVTAFAYALDFDNAATLSSRTFGLRWTGSYPLAGEWRALQATSFARQSDAGDNPVDVSADYWQFEAGLKFRDWSFLVGREVLEGHPALPDRSFQTPLATLHAFQGWADKFTTTPAEGIEDTYVTISGESRELKLQLTWHDFGSQAGDRDYGREWDASVSYRIANRYDLLLKAADYVSGGFSSDTTKLWLQLAANF